MQKEKASVTSAASKDPRDFGNEQIRRRTIMVTGTAVFMLSYVSSVLRYTRTVGLVRLAFELLYNPFLIFANVHMASLLFFFLVNSAVFAAITIYCEKKMSRENLYCLLVAAAAVHTALNTVPLLESQQSIYILQDDTYVLNKLVYVNIVASLLIAFPLYSRITDPANFLPLVGMRNETTGDLSGKQGLISYICAMADVRGVYCAIGLSFLSATLLSPVLNLGLFEAFASSVTTSVKFLMFCTTVMVIYHTYVYNLKYFSRSVEALADQNTLHSPYNTVVLNSYIEQFISLPAPMGTFSAIADRGIEKPAKRRPNVEVVAAHFLDTIKSIHSEVKAIVRSQRGGNISMKSLTEGNSIRKVPKVLLLEKTQRKREESERDNLEAVSNKERGFLVYSGMASEYVYSFMFRVFANSSLKRIYHKVIALRRSVYFLKIHLSADPYRLRKTINIISHLKNEVTKLKHDSLGIRTTLSSWVTLLEK